MELPLLSQRDWSRRRVGSGSRRSCRGAQALSPQNCLQRGDPSLPGAGLNVEASPKIPAFAYRGLWEGGGGLGG